MTALQAGYSQFRLALRNPGEVALGDETSRRMAQYALGWRAYTNEAFSRTPHWAAYAEAEGLHLRTKGFVNPTRRVVDFYVGSIYQGVLTSDGNAPPDGSLLAIPISRDTPEEVRLAIAQVQQWSNWQEEKDIWIMFGASMGDGPAIVVDDVSRGVVYQKPVNPMHVKEIDFNPRGDAIYFKIEYGYFDRAEKRQKTYRQVADKDTIQTWADIDKDPYVEPNIYGFVPMVWARHSTSLGQFGAPAIRCWEKVELLDSLITRVDANIRIHSQSPFFISGEGEATSLTIDGKKNSQNDLKAIKIKGDMALHGIPNNLTLADAEVRIASLMAEIERDQPETTMYERLSQMSTLTGPAADRILGNVASYVQGARSRYDNQYRKLCQMSLAIGGMRYAQRNRPVEGSENGWAANTEAQKKFALFNLDSYARGDLDFSIDPRPLVPETSSERWANQQAYFAAKRAGMDAEFPLDYQLASDGVSDKDIAELKKAQQESDLMLMGDGFRASNQSDAQDTNSLA